MNHGNLSQLTLCFHNCQLVALSEYSWYITLAIYSKILYENLILDQVLLLKCYIKVQEVVFVLKGRQKEKDAVQNVFIMIFSLF